MPLFPPLQIRNKNTFDSHIPNSSVMALEKATITEAPTVDSYEPTSKLEKEFGEEHDALDSSAQVLATSSYDYTEAEAKAVRWKIDWRLMPVLLITGMLSAIDKIIISNAALYG